MAKPVDAAELREVQAELGRNSHYLKTLYEYLVSGDVTDEEYRDMKLSYEAKIASLNGRERELRETARLSMLETSSRDKAADIIGSINHIDDLTAEIVDALVDKILVFEDKRIEISFKFRTEGVAND